MVAPAQAPQRTLKESSLSTDVLPLMLTVKFLDLK